MKKVVQKLLFLSLASFVITSCEKGEEAFPGTPTTEKTLIKLPEGGNGLITIALDLTPGVAAINVLEIRRDAVSAAALNSTQVVKIAKSNAILSDLSGASVAEIPNTLYSSHVDNPYDGQYWTVTFKPGEFVKHLKFNLDPSQLITAGKVGMGFLIAEAKGCQISDAKSQVAVAISAKNQYDGIYRVYGTFFHPTNPDITGAFGTPNFGGQLLCEMITTGAASLNRNYGGVVGESVVVYNNVVGVFTYFTGVKMRFSVNANNTVNVIPVPTFIAVDPSPYNCTYNPATRTFTLNYGWTSGAQRLITENLVWVRAR